MARNFFGQRAMTGGLAAGSFECAIREIDLGQMIHKPAEVFRKKTIDKKAHGLRHGAPIICLACFLLVICRFIGLKLWYYRFNKGRRLFYESHWI